MAEKKQKKGFISGYSKVSYLLNTIFNVSLSLILILCAIPFLLIIALLVKIRYSGPVLYEGVRLGINKTPFIMYKFRTLILGAEKIIGAELLTEQVASGTKLTTTFGRFLRDTRLDELPQLFNILKGDMDFLGPRPERPEIYEKFCKQIRGYDKRFVVKPGLIGYSQLFTPHSSPKRIRTLIDNRFLIKKQKFLWDTFIVLFTIAVVLVRIFHNSSKFIWNNLLKGKVMGLYSDKRKLERVRLENATAYLGPDSNDKEVFIDEAKLMDINDDAILIYTDNKIEYKSLILKMEIIFKTLHGRRNRKKIAICHGTVYKRIKIDGDHFTYAYIIKYTPVSPLNSYMVHQYFLNESII